MKLYTLNHNLEIIELIVIEETPIMFFYKLVNGISIHGVRKTEVDKAIFSSCVTAQIATSEAILKNIVIQVTKHNYEFYKKQLEQRKRRRDDLIAKMSK